MSFDNIESLRSAGIRSGIDQYVRTYLLSKYIVKVRCLHILRDSQYTEPCDLEQSTVLKADKERSTYY